MHRRRLLALGFALPLGTSLLQRIAWAHGPTPQKTNESATIPAPPAKVWAAIGTFGDIAKWHPLVASSTVSGEGGDTKRSLVLKAGQSFKAGTLIDGLVDYQADAMSMEWRLAHEDVEVFPVSFYAQILKLAPAGGGSEVTWEGRYYRAETLNDPPPGKDDAAAVAAMEEFVKAGLAGLAHQVGA